ncbi:VWA domain-containing protein [Aureibacillus halotolerans]|uniref:Ca-activated chloride channel family protein n=1 Tax=Aureibacillus halotolerans TaxID=1508390 RepID=A0A4R6UIN1_9BACI|nr:VWA domain-containing protein [Aureibacillus halotolerans]TDQ43034.1 Ca-activated chloride channel family protein [Aureibacillus halotolerans]
MSVTKIKMSILLSSFLVLLVGCSSNAEESTPPVEATVDEEEPNEDNKEEITDVYDSDTKFTVFPDTLEGVVSAPTGEFAGEAFANNKEYITEILNQYPTATGGWGSSEADEMFKQIVMLFAEDYQNPFEGNWQEITIEYPDIYGGKSQLKPKLNVEIILDASGSMVEKVDGESKMSLAKEAIREFTSNFPEKANVALRVYGHKGTTAFDDKEASCESSELVYDLQSYDEAALNNALGEFTPSGWTPMAKALKDSMQDLEGLSSEVNTNLIFLVSDGIETCGGDPVKVAEELKQSDIQPLVNVIGFNVDEEGEQQLKDIAESADGVFAYVENQQDLAEQFDRAEEIAQQWLDWMLSEHDRFDKIFKERQKKIDEYYQIWEEKKIREEDNLFKAIEYLAAQGKIDTDVQDYLESEVRSRILDVNSGEVDWEYKYSSKNNDERVNADLESFDTYFENAN